MAGTQGKLMRPEGVARVCQAPRVAGYRNHRGKLIEGAWEPIVDRADWQAIRPAPSGRRWERRHLLVGIIECGKCGAPLQTGVDPRGRRRYVCRAPANGGCSRTAIVAEPLEEWIADVVFDRVDSPTFARAVRRRTANTDAAELDRQCKADEAALEQLAVDHYVNNDIGRGQFLAASQAIEARLKATRAKLLREQTADLAAQLVGRGEELRAKWGTLGEAERRRHVHAIIARVVVGAGIIGRTGFDPARMTKARGGAIKWV